jgi:hypothetical protein
VRISHHTTAQKSIKIDKTRTQKLNQRPSRGAGCLCG